MSSFAIRNYPWSIDQGDSESFDFTLKNSDGTSVDLSGYTATMKIFWNQGRYPETGYIITNGGEIVITGVCDSDGNISFTIPSSTTETIPASGVSLGINNVQYLIKISQGDSVETLISGPLKVYIKGF